MTSVCSPPKSLDPNDQKSLEGMQKMEKEESPTDATVELDGDDMEGSGEDGDLEGSDSEAAQWADQEQWFGIPSHWGTLEWISYKPQTFKAERWWFVFVCLFFYLRSVKPADSGPGLLSTGDPKKRITVSESAK